MFEAPGAAAAAMAAGAPGDSAAFAFQNVPEPGVVGLSLLAAGGALLRRRRISSARP
jgi:hypothetical protein